MPVFLLCQYMRPVTGCNSLPGFWRCNILALIELASPSRISFTAICETHSEVALTMAVSEPWFVDAQVARHRVVRQRCIAKREPDMGSEAFETRHVGQLPEETAPDGSRVYPLLRMTTGGMAQFELDPQRISRAVVHRSVDEIWFVISGGGEMWRKSHGNESTVALEPGICVSIPAGTAFQFRNPGRESLRIVAVTIPPWPGDDEAVAVTGRWDATP